MITQMEKIITPSVIALIPLSILLLIRGIAFRLVYKWADRTDTKIDNIIIESLKTPSIYWCFAIGLYIGAEVSDMPNKYVVYFSKAIHIAVIFSITTATANLAGKIFRSYIQKSDLPIPTTGLTYGILKGTIIVIGCLVTLRVLGISIAPLLTALGVGGLAVALALQDTLANLFAGIHIVLEKSIRVGDFIKLETGQEEYVKDITWRT